MRTMDITSDPAAPAEAKAPARTTKVTTALAVGLFLCILAGGSTLGLRHFVFEPQEEKAAFVEVASSTDSQLHAKSIDELISLDTRISDYSYAIPAMHYSAVDEIMRVEDAIAAKKGSQL
jgi:hypothetical protein